eukprot:jgi/Chlat1/2257/Chrsp17S02567
MAAAGGKSDLRSLLGEQLYAPEDRVEYFLYPDGSASQQALLDLRAACLERAGNIAAGHIWQKEPFDLAPVPAANQANKFVPAHLAGSSKLGESIEDEWLIVYILTELTRALPNISAAVRDADGQFLLIEVALHLPRWLNPQNSDNRVFIRGGKLCILQQDQTSGGLPLQAALQSLKDQPDAALPSAGAQAAIDSRLECYPSKIKRLVHTARARLPSKVAQVLRHEPQLASLAVDAFYYRDLDDMKAAAAMRNFSPSDDELVDVMVTLNRSQYAILSQQPFEAPKGFTMPPPSHPDFAATELGMKLAVGFEILYQRGSSAEADAVRLASPAGASSTSSTAVPKNDAAWERFLESLTEKGYFRGNIPGSQEYRSLLSAAAKAYRQTSAHEQRLAALSKPSQTMDALLQQPFSAADFPASYLRENDDDRWLREGDDTLESMLMQRQKEMDEYNARKRSRAFSPATESSRAFHPEDVVNRMTSFVDKLSSFEGAELPDDGLDVSRFMSELQNALGLSGDAARHADADSEDDFMSTDDDSESESDSEEEEAQNAPARTANVSQNARDTPMSSGPPRFKMFHPATEDEEPDSDDEQEAAGFMQEYSEVLDEQLRGTAVGQGFERETDAGTPTVKSKEVLAPVNVDVNLVKNMLASYSAQEGLAGPASTLLGAMGLNLPDNLDDVD